MIYIEVGSVLINEIRNKKNVRNVEKVGLNLSCSEN